MRAIEAKSFSGYGGLRQIELPKPQPATDRVLVRVTAAGVASLAHTILSGGHPRAKANAGAGQLGRRGHRGFRRLRSRGGKPRSVKPIVERVYPLGEASEALRHLTEDRPFGKVVLAG